jgi:hypothetical protein
MFALGIGMIVVSIILAVSVIYYWNKISNDDEQ